jgi:dolichyl-diphosphooligosaccharide--protein glycosyltransferase
VALAGLVLLTITGVIAPWTGRFYSLWDTGYAKIHIPIIASVSEHQPTAWPAYFFDLNMLIWLFPAGVYLCFLKLNDEQVFIVVYSILASYFSGVMVRLMLTLTPIVCVSAAMALSYVLDTYLTIKSPAEPTDAQVSEAANGSSSKKTGKQDGLRSMREPLVGIYTTFSKTSVVSAMTAYLLIFVLHCTWVTSNAYSSPSVVLASRMPDGSQHIIDDYREAYQWLRQNTAEDAKIMSWWDYGYQIGGMADRPTLVDNNTWNNTHIATVGKAMSSREEISYPIMRQHEVDYVLVVFGGLLGYSGDDINKFLWMVRIAEGIWPDEVKERDFFTDRGEYRVDEGATETMKNSLMYEPLFHCEAQWLTQHIGTRCHTTTTTRSSQPGKRKIESEALSCQMSVQRSIQLRRLSPARTGSSESTRSRISTTSAETTLLLRRSTGGTRRRRPRRREDQKF